MKCKRALKKIGIKTGAAVSIIMSVYCIYNVLSHFPFLAQDMHDLMHIDLLKADQVFFLKRVQNMKKTPMLSEESATLNAGQ